MLFLYKLHMLGMLLNNFKRFFISAVLFVSYAFCSSFIFTVLNEGLWILSSNNVNPRRISIYVYEQIKWYYYNTDYITYLVSIKLLASLLIPYFVYSRISSINWGKMLKSGFKKLSSRNNDFSEKTLDFNDRDDSVFYLQLELAKKTILDEVNNLIEKKLLEFTIEFKKYKQNRLLENDKKNYKDSKDDLDAQ